jgi:hypothetical protein
MATRIVDPGAGATADPVLKRRGSRKWERASQGIDEVVSNYLVQLVQLVQLEQRITGDAAPQTAAGEKKAAAECTSRAGQRPARGVPESASIPASSGAAAS